MVTTLMQYQLINMLHETFHLMSDSLAVARKIRNLKFESFKELEILMKKESNFLKKLMLVIHHDLTTRNDKYLH